jgi:effector-binding domain-containing protein
MNATQPCCSIVPVHAVLLAVGEAELDRSQIAVHIRSLFPYAWLKTASVKQVGHNYAIYERGTRKQVLVRAGFPVSGPFAEAQSAKCFTLAAGEAAHAVHIGPYSELHRTYARLDAWCKEQGIAVGGQSWELYGDWHDDPSKLETGIYYRVK